MPDFKNQASLLPCPFCGRPPHVAQEHAETDVQRHVALCYCGTQEPTVKRVASSQEAVIAAWNHRVMPWIRVAEHLPAEEEAVLCAVEFDGPNDWRIKVGGYAPNFNEAHREWHIFGASWTPTHWMQLPAPPKDTIA